MITSSKRMADDLQECAIKAGWSASMTTSISKGAGRKLNGYDLPDCEIWEVYLRSSKARGGVEKKTSARLRPRNKSLVAYDDYVYCVSVPSSGFVIRRNGLVTVTGNCIPMRHDPARHCVTVKLPQYDSDEPWQDPRDPNGEELMWPERFGEFEVSNLEKALGPYLAAGRLQQLPTPKGGGIIQRDWWQPWDKEEATKYGLEWEPGNREFPKFELVVASLDTAFKEKEENDFNAMTVWGIFLDKARNRRAMLMYAWNKRLPLHGQPVVPYPNELPINFKQRKMDAMGLVELVADTCSRYKVKRLLIEDASRGHDVANELRRLYNRENWGVQLLKPVGDKVSRAHSVVPLFADGAIFAPDTRWADAVITQCLIAGTKILTHRGIVFIEDIQVGDMVLTHRGRFRPVLRTFKRKASEFVRIEGKSLDPLVITPEHPFYAVELNSTRKIVKEADWVEAKNIKSRMYRHVIRDGEPRSEAYPSPCHAVTLPKIKREEQLTSIDLREWAFLPSGKRYSFIENETFMRTSHAVSQSVKWNQILDRRFGRFLGLFLAEGCARKNCISWSFHEEETDFVEEITSFIEERIGCGVYFDDHSQSCRKVCTNIPLILSFFHDFGTYAHNKKIPAWVWDAPNDFIEGLISGWVDGDGTYTKFGWVGTTTSISLAWGIRLLMIRLNKKVTLTSHQKPDIDDILGRLCHVRDAHVVSFRSAPDNRGSALLLEDIAAFSVMKSSSITNQEQDVYNFEVAEDNSYCTTGGLVHNCQNFPKGAHDDLVDSCTMLLNWARESGLLERADEATAAMEDSMLLKGKQTSISDLYGV